MTYSYSSIKLTRTHANLLLDSKANDYIFRRFNLTAEFQKMYHNVFEEQTRTKKVRSCKKMFFNV